MDKRKNRQYKNEIKMNKTLLFTLLLSFVSLSAWADRAIVKGQIVDRETRQGEPYATFKIWKGENVETPLLLTITDEEGHFEATLSDTGTYFLEVSALGRKTIHKSFSVVDLSETIDLGILPIEDDAEMLQSVTVTALRPLVKMDVDKMTYRVEDDVDARTTTVLDMLRKVPMVTVDGQDQISVNGSKSFKVLLDGKPSIMMSSNPSDVFKSMPASAVKNIEVITNPGVQYDAEGVGGVLNIITKDSFSARQNTDGYNATLRANATSRGAGGGMYFSAQKGKFSVSANFNGMYNRIKGTESQMLREQLSPLDGSVLSSVSQQSTQLLKVPTIIGTLSLGYEIDSLRLLSAAFGVNRIGSNNENTVATSIITGESSLAYTGWTENAWNMNSLTGSVDYQRSFTGHKDRILTLSYQFSSSPTNTDTRTLIDKGSTYLAPSRKTDGDVNTVENTFQIDYSTPFGKGLSFNVGGKYINRLNRSNQAYYLDDGDGWVYDEIGSLVYRHDNHIIAGYGEYTVNRDKFGAKAGLRYEHTFVNVNYLLGNGTDFNTDYGNLVPAASIQYNFSQSSNIGMSYNMRISRPGITYLNPYRDTSDPTALSYGNTMLNTERAHNVNLVYNFYSPKVMLNLTTRYTHTGNAIGQYRFYDENRLLNSTYGNIIANNTFGLNAFVNWNIGDKTRLSGNGSIDHVTLSSMELNERNSGWTGSAYIGLQHTFPWDIRFSSNLIYAAKSISLEGWDDGTTMLMGSFTKSFLDDNLSLGITGVTGFARHGNLNRASESKGADYHSYSFSSVPMAQVMVSISYSFGKNNRKAAVKSTRKTIENDDLKNQRNQAEEMGTMMSM